MPGVNDVVGDASGYITDAELLQAPDETAETTDAAADAPAGTPGKALDDGAMGDVIRVTNLSSGREVKALVTGHNTVMAQTNMR